jgi:polyhydroxyalkanoate synthase
LVRTLRQPCEDAIVVNGDQLPVDLLQALFSTIDPGGIERKFRAFAALDPGSAKAGDFVAVEDWLNDGVPLTGPVARECLFGWYAENLPARGGWSLADRLILPQMFTKPALSLIPAKDRIVPPGSALSLARAFPNGQTKIIDAGHIGMVTGERTRAEVYDGLADWLLLMGGR